MPKVWTTRTISLHGCRSGGLRLPGEREWSWSWQSLSKECFCEWLSFTWCSVMEICRWYNGIRGCPQKATYLQGGNIFARSNSDAIDCYWSELYELLCLSFELPSGHLLLVCGVYHPPQPTYRPSDFLQCLVHLVTLGARDFSSAVSGFCQVFIVTRANTENSDRTREKPLVPRVSFSRQCFRSTPWFDHCFGRWY